MDTHLGAIRDYIFADRSWASTGSTLNARVNGAINRSLREISGEVPEALVPKDMHTRVLAPVTSTDAAVNATIGVETTSSDPKVMQFTIDASSSWFPDASGEWDGVMHLEITDGDGRKRRRQSREWWLAGGVYYVSLDRPWRKAVESGMSFEIYQPEFFLPGNTIDVLSPILLYDESEQLIGQISPGTARREHLPDFSQRVQGRPTDFWRGRFFQMPTPMSAPRVTVVETGTAQTPSEDVSLTSGATALVSGLPISDPVEDGGQGSLSTAQPPRPTFDFSGYPTTADVKHHDWLGPSQEGKFRFRYTYGWGRTENEWGDAHVGIRDPIWESAPSPASVVFDHAAAGAYRETAGGEVSGVAVNIRVDNIDQILDFVGITTGIDVTAGTYPHENPKRYGKSGMRVRIYVARDAVYETHGPNANTTTDGLTMIQREKRLNHVPSDGRFYLLTEIDPLDLDPTLASRSVAPIKTISSFTWDGRFSVTNGSQRFYCLPDKERPLRKITGYYAYHLWPLPDKDYDLDLSILQQPMELVNDNDPVPIKQEAVAAFLELCLAYMSRLDGVDQASELKHRQIYRQLLRRFRSQHGNSGGIVEPRGWIHHRGRNRLGQYSEA